MVHLQAGLRHREEVAPGYHLLELEALAIAAEALPGQFVHVRVTGTQDPLLRRPISILRADKHSGHIWLLSRTVGRGTGLIAQLQAGSVLDLVGPLGNAFPVAEECEHAILVAGGVGVAPLTFLAQRLRDERPKRRITGLYGAATEDALAMWLELSALCDEFACSTEDGSAGEEGLVTTLLERELEIVSHQAASTVAYTCGPRAMMAAVSRLCAEAGVPCWASLEQFMGCGIGACLGCVVPTRLEPRFQRVCKDGPVFDAQDVLWAEVDA